MGLEGVYDAVLEAELLSEGLGRLQLGAGDAGRVGGYGESTVTEDCVGLDGQERAVDASGIGHYDGAQLFNNAMESGGLLSGVCCCHDQGLRVSRAAFIASERLDTLINVMSRGATSSLGVDEGIIPVSSPNWAASCSRRER